jgi:hypothetical protein
MGLFDPTLGAKNRDPPRMGHPDSWNPMSQIRDMGHPSEYASSGLWFPTHSPKKRANGWGTEQLD